MQIHLSRDCHGTKERVQDEHQKQKELREGAGAKETEWVCENCWCVFARKDTWKRHMLSATRCAGAKCALDGRQRQGKGKGRNKGKNKEGDNRIEEP